MENPLGIKCDSPGCNQIVGASARYCTQCGIRVAAIEFPQADDNGVVEAVWEGGHFPLALKGADATSVVNVERLDGRGQSLGKSHTPFGMELRFDLSGTKDGESTVFEIETDDARVRKDPWNPASTRKRTVRVVTRHPRTEVVPIPAVAIFPNDRDTAVISVENRGNRTAFVVPQPPYGYECVRASDVSGFEIAPKGSYALELRRTQGEPGKMDLVDRSGSVIDKVQLLPAAAPKTKIRPGFVVAIDFGTSNTSVYCRETKTGDVAPISLMGDGKVRRETLLYAPANVARFNWRAIDVTGLPQNKITRDLKTLLRENEAGVKERVRFYLEAMLKGGIEAELAARNPDDARRVEFVFTIPVLDYTGEPGPEHIAYRDALVEAATAAGYVDPDRGWSVTTIMEPDGGALDVMDATKSMRPYGDGEYLLVIDIGGGTTDVTFGKIRLVNGRPRLEETENLSLGVQGEQFGGERATRLLGDEWAGANPDGELPPKNSEGFAKMAANEKDKVSKIVFTRPDWVGVEYQGQIDTEKWETLSEWGDVTEGVHEPSVAWPKRLPGLFIPIRRAKHHLSDEANALKDMLYKIEPFRFGPADANDRSWAVPYALLDEATKGPIHEIVERISEFLREKGISPRQVRHVATIGGSARLPGLQQQLSDLFPASSLIPIGEYTDVAVCRGASRLYQDAPPLLPVGFELRIGDNRVTLATAGASLVKTVPKVQEVIAPARTQVPVEIDVVTSEGNHYPFLRYAVSNYEGDVAVRLSPSSLTLQFQPPLPGTSGDTTVVFQ